MSLAKRNLIFSKFAEIAEEWKLTSEMKVACEDLLRKRLDSYEGWLIENKENLPEAYGKEPTEEFIKYFVIGFTEGVVDAMYYVTRNMKKMGLDVSLIQKYTGLSPDEIEKL